MSNTRIQVMLYSRVAVYSSIQLQHSSIASASHTLAGLRVYSSAVWILRIEYISSQGSALPVRLILIRVLRLRLLSLAHKVSHHL